MNNALETVKEPSLGLPGKVIALESVMRAMPQVELRTDHHFADGMYGRCLFMPAGTVVVGKRHKREHLFVITKGRMQVVVDGEVKHLSAGDVLVSAPGAKRALHAIEDSICMTVHRTNKKNIRKIEKELIHDDGTALFDAFNKLKVLP